jgi:AcrR family transcriptional regulator
MLFCQDTELGCSSKLCYNSRMGRRKKGEDDATIKNRLVERIGELFFSRGIASLTMDMVSRSFQVSKKTLYRFFPNKEEMVLHVAGHFIKRIGSFAEGKLAEIDARGEESFIPVIMEVLGRLGSVVLSMPPSFLQEMENNSPVLFDKIDAVRRELIIDVFGRILQKGKALGKIRQDIDTEITSHVYAGMLKFIASRRGLGPSHAPFDVYMTVVKIMFEGILQPEVKRDFHTEALPLQTAGSPWDLLSSRSLQKTEEDLGAHRGRPDQRDTGR